MAIKNLYDAYQADRFSLLIVPGLAIASLPTEIKLGTPLKIRRIFFCSNINKHRFTAIKAGKKRTYS
jgi:hypothetical protein